MVNRLGIQHCFTGSFFPPVAAAVHKCCVRVKIFEDNVNGWIWVAVIIQHTLCAFRDFIAST